MINTYVYDNYSFECYKTAPNWWDQAVQDNEGSFFCSTIYGAFFEKSGLGNTHYFEVLKNGKRQLLFIASECLIGYGIISFLPQWFQKILRRFSVLRMYTAHLQPVICDPVLKDNESELRNLINAVIEYLNFITSQRGISIMPLDLICFEEKEHALDLCKTAPNTYLVGTSRLELVDSEVSMMALLNKKLRYSIKKAVTSNAEVREVDADCFYSALSASWRSNGMLANAVDYYISLKKYCPQNLRYYIVYVGDTPLAGSGMAYFGTAAVEFSMFVTQKSRDLIIPGGELLKWHLIKHSIELRCKTFDLNMVNVDEFADQKTSAINFFKLKWGGKILYGVKIEKLSGPLQAIRKLKVRFIGK